MSRTSRPPTPRDGAERQQVEVLRDGRRSRDQVVAEEPLEIRVDDEAVAVTMRTPGEDVELALGFLHGEGWVESRADVADVASVAADVVDVRLEPAARSRFAERQEEARRFPVTSACGVCGKPSLDDLWQRIPRLRRPPIGLEELDRRVTALPGRMRQEQRIFADTGGCHAAALFDVDGELLDLHEDVGRHNAVDKLVGAALLGERLPFAERLLVTSGRAGYEIVQKALAAGAPVLVAVGATTSLAVRLARLGGLVLYSFVDERGGNRHPLDPEPPPRLRKR